MTLADFIYRCSSTWSRSNTNTTLFSRALTDFGSNWIPNETPQLEKATDISQKILDLSEGKTYTLKKEIKDPSYDITLYLQFTRKGSDISLVLYNICSNLPNYKKALYDEFSITNLELNENTNLIERICPLSNCSKNNQLLQMIQFILTHQHYYSNFFEQLKTYLLFLQSNFNIIQEAHSPRLLFRQSDFTRAMYRLLYPYYPDQNALENELLHFIRETILSEQKTIQPNHPALYEQTIRNHIAYFQETNCKNELEKQDHIQPLIELLDSNKLLPVQGVITSELSFTPIKSRPIVSPPKELTWTYEAPHQLPDRVMPADNLIEYATYLNEALQRHAKNNPHWCMTEIERFVLSCPFKLDNSDPIIFGDLLDKIQAYYLDAFNTHLDGQQTPQIWITLYSLMLFRNQCIENIYPHLQDEHPIFKQTLGPFLSKIKHLPHFSTQNPDFDARWLEVCSFLSQYKDKIIFFTPNIINAYTFLIEKDPNAKQLKSEFTQFNHTKERGQREDSLLGYYINHHLNQQPYSDLAQQILKVLKVEVFFKKCFSALNLLTHSPSQDTLRAYSGVFNSPLNDIHSYTNTAPFTNNPKFITSTDNHPDSLEEIALREPTNYALKNKIYSSNSIPLDSHTGETNREMTPDDIRLRRMLEEGLLENPLPSVLTHYISKLSELKNPDAQYYCLKRLLHGASLLRFMQQPEFPDYLVQFDAFIEKGLKFSQINGHQLTSTSLFFIDLAIKMHVYLTRNNKNHPKLMEWLDRIDLWLPKYNADPDIAAPLHEYRLSILLLSQELFLNIPFEKAFISYSYLTVFKTKHDEALQDQFKHWFATSKEEITPTSLRDLAITIDLDLKPEDTIIRSKEDADVFIIRRDNEILFYFPIKLFQFLNPEGLIYSATPETLLNHPVFSYLDQKPKHVFRNLDNSIVLFAHDEKETRLEFDADQKVRIFQTLLLGEEKERFQFMDVNGSNSFIQDKLQLLNSFNNRYKNIQFQDTLKCWVSLQTQKTYFVDQHKIIYTSESNQNIFCENGLQLYLTAHPTLNDFEPQSFSHAQLTPEGNGVLHLIHYPQLNFKIDSGILYLVDEGVHYQQTFEKNPFLLIPHLVFHETEDSNKKIAIVPVREFNTKVDHSIQKVMFYDIDPITQELHTEQADAAFYLTYLYLLAQHYDLALKTLQSIHLVDLNTDADSISVLQYIMNLSLGDTQRLPVCQLLSISLYIRCIQEKLGGHLSSNHPFFACLEKIPEHYHHYKKYAAYLPHHYILDDITIYNLESFFMEHRSISLNKNKIQSAEKTITRVAQNLPSYYWSSLPDNIKDNLFTETSEEKPALKTLIAVLNAGLTEEQLKSYFPHYVKMSQGNNKAHLVEFLNKYLQCNPRSDYARILYHLCHYKIDSTQTTFSLNDLISKKTNPPELTYPSLKTTEIEIEYATSKEPIPLSLSLENPNNPLKQLSLFLKRDYPNFNLKDIDRSELLDKLKGELTPLKEHLAAQWEIIKQAVSTNLMREYPYFIAAGYHALPSEKELMECYARADAQAYRQKTHSNHIEWIQSLHDQIHEAMLSELACAQFERLIQELEIGLADSSKIRWRKLSDLLTREHVSSIESSPILMYLEYIKNIMIRPEQVAIAETLKTSNYTADLIMGAGKTSVITPMLILSTQHGKCPFVIPPPALVKTTHTYLHILGIDLDLIPCFFDFSRHQDYSVKALQRIYHLFQKCQYPIAGKRYYIVTTAYAMQSLELKYFELFLSKNRESYKEQIELLEKILDFVANQGEALIDEIHDVQNPSTAPVRYPLNPPEPVADQLLQDILRLYKFKSSIDDPNLSKETLIENLLSHPESPIIKHLEQCYKDHPATTKEVINENIKTYLLGKSSLILQNGQSRFRTLLNTLQQSIQLTEVLKRLDYKTHFGPSKDEGLTALEKAIAMPYRANEKPKEGSSFAKLMVRIIYTIESLSHEFSLDLMAELIEEWRKDALAEYQNPSNQFDSFENTTTALNFHKYFGQILSQNPSTRTPEELQDLLKSLKNNPEFFYESLHSILHNITKDLDILESGAFDHLFLYRFFRGLTATPDHTNQYIQIYDQHSKGARQEIEAALIEQRPDVIHLDYTDPENFFNTLISSHPQKSQLRAIIDIGGRLKGETQDIATSFAAALSQHTSVKYVLYFDSKDELHAVSTQPPYLEKRIGRSTDAKTLEKILKCSIDDMAVFYDQDHTKGTDFVLKADAYGEVILGDNSTLDPTMQGIMRLRDFLEQQRIRLILTKNLSHLTDSQAVLTHIKQKTQEGIPSQTIANTLSEASGHVREQAKKTLFSKTSFEDKSIYLESIRSLFIQPAEDVEEEKKYPSNQLKVQTYVNNLQEKLEPGTDLSPKLTSILSRPIPEHESSSIESTAPSEVQTQIQIEIQVVPPGLGVYFDPALVANEINPWTNKTAALNPLMPTSDFNFSNTLYVSENFMQIYKHQNKDFAINPYMKPVNLILFYKSQNRVSACLITPEDAKDPKLLKMIKENSAYWISTTQHIVYIGQKPHDIEGNNQYQKLIEEIRFFGGKFAELNEQTVPYHYLIEQPETKFKAYKMLLEKPREIDEPSFKKLQANLSRRVLIFQKMTQNPFVDYTNPDYSWTELDPDVTDEDIEVFQQLGRTYQKMNQDYFDYSTRINITSLQKTLGLHPLTLGSAQQHLRYLLKCKSALLAFHEYSTEIPYTQRLEQTEDREIIDKISGIATWPTPEEFTLDLIELNILGHFLASRAFPTGARALFIAPIQARLDALPLEKWNNIFVSSSLKTILTEYTLRYLLDALNFGTDKLGALLDHVSERETVFMILKRSQGDEHIIKICLERYPQDQDILNSATQAAVHKTTFTSLLGFAKQANCLFSETWLTLLLNNPNLPLSTLSQLTFMSLHNKKEINDLLLQKLIDDTRFVEQLTSRPESLIFYLTQIHAYSDNIILKQNLTIHWLYYYATHKSAQNLLVIEKYHACFDVFFTNRLTVKTDIALEHLMKITSEEALFKIIGSILTCYQKNENYLLPEGKVYSALLDAYETHHETIDGLEFMGLLVDKAKTDIDRQRLMQSKYLSHYAKPFVSRTQDLTWLITHPQTSEALYTHIMLDYRFDAALAIFMLKQNLPQDIMTLCYQKTLDLFTKNLRKFNSEGLALLISKRANDEDLKKLMQGTLSSTHAEAFISQTQDLTWLITHPNTPDSFKIKIMEDRRFTPDLALFMLKQNLNSNISTLCYQKTMDLFTQNPQVFNSEGLALLISKRANDEDLKKLMQGTLSSTHAEAFISQARDLTWLITHPNTPDSFKMKIMQDRRFTPELALLMLKQNLNLNISALCYQKTMDLFIQNPRKFNPEGLALLISKNVNEADLLKIIPYCSEEELQRQLAAKIQTVECAGALLEKAQWNPSVIPSVSITLLNEEIFQKSIRFPEASQKIIDLIIFYTLSTPNAVCFDQLRLIANQKLTSDSLNAILGFNIHPNTTNDNLHSLIDTADRLRKKALSFIARKEDRYDEAAQAATKLYLCLYHQLYLYQNDLIKKEDLKNNLNEALLTYKDILSAHRGYRQIVYDIAQALSCFLFGLGFVLTAYAYATTGSLRFFVHKNESQKMIETLKDTLNTSCQIS